MSDYERIARVIRYLDRHRREQPALDELGAEAGLSRFHFHRLFVRWAGITPKAFLQCLTVAHARALLERGNDVLSAALEAGLSGPGRLHDLTVHLEAASPGELKSGGAGWTIRAGFAPTPFGTCRVAEGPRGICDLAFVEDEDREQGERALRDAWPAAAILWDRRHARALAERVFRREHAGEPPLRALVRGSRFQVRVWRALLSVPADARVGYGRLAAAAGRPGAARAVGTELGRNPLAFLIPCHRVIRETGAAGEYRWGPVRKKALLAWETARAVVPERPAREDET